MTTQRRLAIVLPGLHRVNRGAETAFESIGREIARISGWEVTLFGSGERRPDEPYEFVHVPCKPRERFEKWPRLPLFRSETAWEEFTFVRRLLRVYDPSRFDASMTCSYPFCNWFLRARRDKKGQRPAHLFVTQNGDWPCYRKNSEYRPFGCDMLICTNPDYYESHHRRYRASLIPNGVDPSMFMPGLADRSAFGLPDNAPIVLMVAALIPSKRVLEGIGAAAKVDGTWVVVAGDGPLRDEVARCGKELLGERFRRISVPLQLMPHLYRCADVVVHMSVDEPFGNVFTEALATGLPIVTHDRAVSRWTLEETSYLTDALNLDAVAATIKRALGERRGSRVDDRLRLVRDRYTWSAIAAKYCEAIESAGEHAATACTEAIER